MFAYIIGILRIVSRSQVFRHIYVKNVQDADFFLYGDELYHQLQAHVLLSIITALQLLLLSCCSLLPNFGPTPDERAYGSVL